MPYLGRPVTNAGQFEIIDDISSGFNGSETSFTLQVGGTDIQPDAANVTIVLDGVVQIPSSAYAVTASTLNFSEAPTSGTEFHGVLAGQSQFIESDFIVDSMIKSTANISGSKINTDFSAQTVKAAIFDGMVSGSAQLADDISGSFSKEHLGAKVANVVTSSAQIAADISGSFGNQRVGTSDSPTFAGGTVTGDFAVGGTLTAQEVHTEFESASILFTSGSTIFGNSSDDVHNMTGSLNISGSLFVKDGTLTVTDNVDFNGDLDVDGTTNLDVVDIDGAVDMASKLVVAGQITGSSTTLLGGNVSISSQGNGLSLSRSGYDTYAFQHSTGNGMAIFNISDDRNEMHFKGDGNVGINETAPITKLDVRLDSTDTNLANDYSIFINNQTGASTGRHATIGFGTYNNGGLTNVFGAVAEGTGAQSGFAFLTHNGGALTEKVRFKNDGKVGIGTNNPATLLHVSKSNGDVRFTFGSDSQLDFSRDANGVFMSVGSNQHLRFLYDNQSSEAMRIADGGFIGIGTNNPSTVLHTYIANGTYSNESTSHFINQAGNNRATIRNRSDTDNPSEIFFDINGAIRWCYSARETSDNTIRLFPQASSPSLTGVAGSVFTLTQGGNLTIGGSYSPFTGTHLTVPASGSSKLSSVQHWSSSLDDYVGKIVVSSGTFIDNKYQSGSIAKTIDEAWPQIELANAYKDKKVLGVVSGIEGNPFIENTPQNEFELRQNEHRFIGVNSLGEGCIWISNLSGSLENGDYITSSPIEGYGMKQDDDLLHNYTVAKISEDCDFSGNGHVTSSITHNGVTYKTAFVGCTYHCG